MTRQRASGNTGSIVSPELETPSDDFFMALALAQRLAGLETTLHPVLASERFDQAMAALATLRKPIDEFFERVTVNAPEKELRENRLRLLTRIRATMNQVADFSQIEG